MTAPSVGDHNHRLVVAAALWILAAALGGAVLGAVIGDATCNDAEHGSLACTGSVGSGLFVGFVLGLLAGWLTTWLVWTRLPAMRGAVLLVAPALIIAGVVLALTATNGDNPSPSPAFEFGPNDALP